MLAPSLIELSLHFKTQPCIISHPESFNDSCEFYHSESDRRRPCVNDGSSSYLNILYIPKLVPECNKEKFALNLAEYNYHILNIKTKPCPYMSIDHCCPLQKNCPYIHKSEDNLDELNAYRSKFVGTKAPSAPLAAMKKVNEFTTVLENGEEAYISGTSTSFKEDSEHAFLQLKTGTAAQVEKNLKVIQEYLCAFANSNGGTLFIGVRQSGHIVGAACDRATLDRVRLAIDHAV